MTENETKSFTINPDIVFDTIDGEVILLNIEKGNYYQLKNEAVLVWEEIASKKISSALVVADSLSRNEAYSQNEILDSINPFINQLKTEQILLEVKESGSKKENARVPATKEKKKKGKFPTPVLLKYTDMQSILLLDPIHDTNEEGWPNKKSKKS